MFAIHFYHYYSLLFPKILPAHRIGVRETFARIYCYFRRYLSLLSAHRIGVRKTFAIHCYFQRSLVFTTGASYWSA
jgi:hypothetical protein